MSKNLGFYRSVSGLAIKHGKFSSRVGMEASHFGQRIDLQRMSRSAARFFSGGAYIACMSCEKRRRADHSKFCSVCNEAMAAFFNSKPDLSRKGVHI